jgi:ribosomal protein S18 acetylase RimI-like enzyme
MDYSQHSVILRSSPPDPVIGPGVSIRGYDSFPRKTRPIIIDQVTKIEKKTFPSSEAFDFDAELKKRNTTLMLATKEGAPERVVGYLVYVRVGRLVLVHKVCVIREERGQGVGKCLVHSLRLVVEKGGCESIHLWVDEARKPARALYESCGFEQTNRLTDYYGPGRTGLKMQLATEK